MKAWKFGFYTFVGFVVALKLSFVAFTKQGPDPFSAVFVAPTPTAKIDPTPEDWNKLPMLRRLMEPQSDCALPCWWGLRPGTTKLMEIMAFLRKLIPDGNWDISTDLEKQGMGSGLVWLKFSSNWEAYFTLRFRAQQHFLRNLDLTFYYPDMWLRPEVMTLTIPSIIQRMRGIPEIYVGTKSRADNFTLIFVYPVEGVMVEYLLDLTDNRGNTWTPVHICPDPVRIKSVEIWLQSPDEQSPIHRLNLMFVSDNLRLGKDFDIDERMFVNFFIANPDKCLDINLLGVKRTQTPQSPGR